MLEGTNLRFGGFDKSKHGGGGAGQQGGDWAKGPLLEIEVGLMIQTPEE
jgi:hypothetical protein